MLREQIDAYRTVFEEAMRQVGRWFYSLIRSPIFRTNRGHGDLAECLGTGRGLLFGIPRFHAESPVVRGAGSSKEHSLPRNPWNHRGECGKERGLRRAMHIWK